jgi:small multidrug resistance pump
LRGRRSGRGNLSADKRKTAMIIRFNLPVVTGWVAMTSASLYNPANNLKEVFIMSWILLIAAICMEVCGTTCLKLSDGLTKWLPSVLIFVFYGLSFTMMAYAVKKLDLSLTYAIWSGVGTFLIALIGFFWFKEQFTLLKAFSMALVIAGVIGLNLGRSP